MKLSRIQLKALKNALAFKDDPPTVIKLLVQNKRAWAPLPLAAASLMIFAFALPHPTFLFIGGMFAGAFLRDMGSFRAFVHLWPVWRECFNWDKVAAAIASAESINPPSERGAKE